MAAAVVVVTLGGRAAWAADVRIPLTIPYITLDAALKAEMYNGPGGQADFWHGSDCEYLYGRNPQFSRQDGLLRLETDADLNLGTQIGANCINAIAWQGIIQALSTPYVTADWKIKFRVRDLNLYNLQHEKTILASRGFDLVKGYFVPRLEQFSFDLSSPLAQLGQLIEAGTPSEDLPGVKQAMATIATVPPAVPTAHGLRITVRIILPEGVPAPSIAPNAGALTPADIDAWNKALDNWDAFLVFAVKQLAASTPDKEFREDLLDLLLESRQRLVRVLAQPQAAGGPDPVRLLFIDTWSRFDRIVQRAAARGLLGNRTLEFLSFISAGDALIAFDQAAPALGMRITARDLRALAHIMAPRLQTDPLVFSFDQDPELQKLFGIHSPVEIPDALPGGPGDSAPPAAAPPLPADPTSGPATVRGLLSMLERWLTPPAIAAMRVVNIDRQIRAVALKLHRQVPDPTNLDRYRADMSQLLDLSASREVNDDYLEAAYAPTIRRLVRSTAWQESCWRQYVRKGRRITYLESSTRDLGLMQVNKYVWRGFYSIPHLEWDIAYNAGAGTQILLRRLSDCARQAAGGGIAANPDDLARSAYAAYNGGPSACNRWSDARASSTAALVDVSFWLKYQALEQGQTLDILQCSAQWSHAPGH